MGKPRDFLQEHLDAEQDRVREEEAAYKAEAERAWLRAVINELAAEKPLVIFFTMMATYSFITLF